MGKGWPGRGFDVAFWQALGPTRILQISGGVTKLECGRHSPTGS
jgi:hypothetical protein